MKSFSSKGAAAWGFAHFAGALESCLVAHAPLLPQFYPKDAGQGPAGRETCLLPTLLHTEALSRLCFTRTWDPCSSVNFHQRVSAKSHRSVKEACLGGHGCLSTEGWLSSRPRGPASRLILPTPFIRLHCHLLVHPRGVRGLGHNRWLELMPEA